MQGDRADPVDPSSSERKISELSRPRSPTPETALTKVKMIEIMPVETVPCHTQKRPAVEVPVHLDSARVMKNQSIIEQTPC